MTVAPSSRAPRLVLSPLRSAVVIAAGIAVLALSLAGTAGVVFATSDPARALAWWPNAEAKARRAAGLIGDGNSAADAAAARQLAREALDRSPVAAKAATTLGLAYGVSGDRLRERAMFGYSERLTRRELPAQLWAIEDAVARGDVATALLHYDRAMTVSVRSRELLLPVLAAAANDAAVRGPLIAMLRTRPSWWPDLIGRAITIVRSPDALAAILSAVNLRPADIGEQRLLAFGLHQLAQRGGYAQAFDLYRTAGHTRDAARTLRNGGFEAPDDLPPVEWALVDDPVHGAIVEARDGDGSGISLHLLGTETRTDVVARQLMMLRPGPYRLTFQSGRVDADATTPPAIAVTCAVADGLALVTQRLPAGDAVHRSAIAFAVPGGCTAQWIAIASGATAGPEGDLPWIDDIAIVAERPRAAG